MRRARRPRLWVVDPSLAHAEDQGVAEILDGWAGASRVFRPGLRPEGGPDPGTGHDLDGVVIMGSRASVHDDLRWLAALSAWLRPIVAGQVPLPVLGICFGHQLIAHLSGGSVDFVHPDRRKLCGVEISEVRGSRLLPGRHALRVVVSHREEVRRVPADYAVVARRSGVAVDGLEHTRLPVFSFQFHPEAREEFAGHAGIPRAEIDARLRADSGLVLRAFREWVWRDATREPG